MGMANLQGQLNLPPNPVIAMPLLQRAAILATVDVPQPAYVYALLLLSEFPHISLPQPLIQSLLPPGTPVTVEARKYIDVANAIHPPSGE